MFVFAAAYGSVLGDIETFVAENEFYQKIMGVNDEYSIPMMFVSMVGSILSLLGIVPVVTSILKLHKEEVEGRNVNVLSRPVKKEKYLLGYILIGFVLSIVIKIASALGLYGAATAVLSEKIELEYFIKSFIVYLPALWVVMGVAVFLLGCMPKLTALTWVLFGYSFLTTFVGRVLDLPEIMDYFTPFSFIPKLPVEEIEILPLGILVLIAVGLVILGVVGYGKREQRL